MATGSRHAGVRSALASYGGPVLLIVVVAAGASASTPALQRSAAYALSAVVLVLGLHLFIGLTGIYSFGHMGLASIAAYVSVIMSIPLAQRAVLLPELPGAIAQIEWTHPIVYFVVPAVIVAMLAALLTVALIRTSVLAIPISTLAFLIVVREVASGWDAVTRGTSGLVGAPLATSTWTAAVCASFGVIVAVAVKRSATGVRIRATRENEFAAQAMGINVFKERSIAFVLSAAFVGLGGALKAHQAGVLTPDSFYVDLTLLTLTMLVVGGRASVFGAVVGAIGVSALNEFLRSLEDGFSIAGLHAGAHPGFAPIGIGILLLLILLLRPDGITSGREAGEYLRHKDAHAPAMDRVSSSRHARNTAAIEARGISMRFGGLNVLVDVDLTVLPEQIIGLIGPNGAGKTTLINIISGFQLPTAGRVSFDGLDVTRMPAHLRARGGLARTFQAALPFPELTVLENVAVGALGTGATRKEAFLLAADRLALLGLLDLADTRAGGLPVGSQRLLGIARALATEPSLLLLDEPAAGLNETEKRDLVSRLRQIHGSSRVGILLVEHDMDVVMSLSQIVHVLDAGRTIAVGPPEDVRNDPAVIEAYLGTSFAQP